MAIYWARLLCLSFTGMLMAILAGGAVFLQPSDLQPYVSPTTGQFLPPAIAFQAATKLGKFMDDLAFKLRPPMAQISSAASGYQLTQALASFARMHVAEAILASANEETDGLADAFDIARKTTPKSDVDALRRLLRFLTAHRLLLSDGDPSTTRFGLTAATRLLLEEAPGSAWGMVIVQAGDHSDGWANLDASLSHGPEQIAFDHKFGKTIWEHYQQNPKLEAAFASFMTAASQPANAAIAGSGFNFSSSCLGLVDVGGGHGSLLGEIVQSFPSLAHRATVVDQPSVVSSAPDVPAVKFHPGDFFDANSLPSSSGSNCFLLKHVLHDWSDAKAVSILRNVRRAMSRVSSSGSPSISTLLVAECVLTEHDPMMPLKAGLDVTMMAMAGGKERTMDEWTELLRNGGFEAVHFRSTRSPLTLIEARMLN